ncbi:long-chain fatty acid--CoA ligase [Pseudomaricurvus alkylphenolicus]|uniref:AMP-binding protein n=1 Tax=Pseudomaricurvus alkylphenolicus TaxID=1306991 RepID=UPI00141F2D92|nr:AMP-binding protein [Pseudomaricurvus alkylphenolicus]NIB41695.1 long-chain fatty acid--CoA ligase [Pseudomaricurvus alkylphenolicus]
MTTYSDKPWLKWYDDHVDAELDLKDTTFLEFIERGLYADEEKAAFHFLGSTCTYKQLNDLSDRFARFLVNEGCQKGDVVGIHLPNLPQYLIALVGTVKAGCVVTGISPLLTPTEFVHQVNDSGAKSLITLDLFYTHCIIGIADQIPNLKNVVVTNMVDFLSGQGVSQHGEPERDPMGSPEQIDGKRVVSYHQLVSSYPANKPEVDLSPDDTCLLSYTGGTTGASKGVVLTQKGFVTCMSQIGQWLGIAKDPNAAIKDNKKEQDIMCAAFPLFHAAGTGYGSFNMAMGNTQILIPDPRDTDQICRDIRSYRPTQLGNVPTLYQMLMDNPMFAGIDFSSVKFCVSAAAPFDVDSIKRLETFVGQGKVVEKYGLTECFTSMNPVNGKKKIGSVGVPVQSTKIKIVDVEDKTTEMPVGEPGELIVSGPQVFERYHNNPKATEESFREFDGDRYFYTGDVARMDEDGFLYIVDRTKDMLLVGGYNVYSKQVEDVLYELPEVELCAIVGKPNPERPGSEIVRAVIQLKASDKSIGNADLKDKITAHCREKLAPYKVPKIIEFCEQVPLTSVGKVDKKALRH